mgnify:CR=1 FL=1|tara:strand:+ start:163 stop:396 length:234 start_codon:yes stop_codon:yes gene_type:complete
MTLFLFTLAITLIAFVGLGVGVLFFGKTAKQEACGQVPEIDTNTCLSQEAGICPIEDRTGALKMQRKTRLSYSQLGK